MKDREFSAEQFIPVPRKRVFEFFSDPANLERITPPWLGFHIAGRSTEDVREGSEFVYRLRIRGLPFGWRSRIEEWRPDERFVDVQLKGPYAKWHHTHTFEERGSGTLIRDHVRYRLPFGLLGDRIAGWFVDRDVREIFAYRAERIAALLDAAGE